MGIENRVPVEEEKPKKEIGDAGDLDELCQILLEKKELVGKRGKIFSAEEDLVPAIQNVKKLVDTFAEGMDVPYQQIVGGLFNEGADDIRRAFTRTEGLRDKVEELVKKYAEKTVKENALKMLKFEPEDKEK